MTFAQLLLHYIGFPNDTAEQVNAQPSGSYITEFLCKVKILNVYKSVKRSFLGRDL